MKQVLFVRPDSRENGKLWWCESGSQQVESLENLSELDILAGHALAGRVCLLLPASETIFRHFRLPKKRNGRPKHGLFLDGGGDINR